MTGRMKLKIEDIVIREANYDVCIQAIDKKTWTPLGYVFLKFKEQNKAEIMGLIRHNEFKGRGIVKGLIEEAENIAREKQVNEIYIGILKERKGVIKLLEKLGYEKSSETGTHELWRKFISKHN